MDRNIEIGFPKRQLIQEEPVELVERKGLGHPDSICDGLAEEVSRALSKEYIERFGRILHHNTDQVELVGGAAQPEYSGGEMIKPAYILLGGRATTQVNEERIPVPEIALEAARKYLDENLKYIDVNSFAELDQRIGQGSTDLMHVFDRKQEMPKANDTSFGVGYAPLSLTEELVLKTEKFINHELDFKGIGEDVKIMGLRRGDRISLTIAAATVSKYVHDLSDYKDIIARLHEEVSSFTQEIAKEKVDIFINTGDDLENESIYLTYTGLSAEQGDDGSVGRGNRVNGLITPYRPVSLEASSGKNPVNHVGKIYNLLAHEIAEDIAKEINSEVHVRLLSQIGHPIDEPMIASVNLIGEDSEKQRVKDKARRITNWWLENVERITKLCLEGKIATF